jgi:hypothetical protein
LVLGVDMLLGRIYRGFGENKKKPFSAILQRIKWQDGKWWLSPVFVF